MVMRIKPIRVLLEVFVKLSIREHFLPCSGGSDKGRLFLFPLDRVSMQKVGVPAARQKCGFKDGLWISWERRHFTTV